MYPSICLLCFGDQRIACVVLSFPCGSWGLNTGQTWWQVPLPAEPSCGPLQPFLFCFMQLHNHYPAQEIEHFFLLEGSLGSFPSTRSTASFCHHCWSALLILNFRQREPWSVCSFASGLLGLSFKCGFTCVFHVAWFALCFFVLLLQCPIASIHIIKFVLSIMKASVEGLFQSVAASLGTAC